MRADRLVPLDLASVPHRRIVLWQMSVHDNLEVGAFTVRDPSARAKTFGKVYDLFPRLDERPTQPAATMSRGEQQLGTIALKVMMQLRLMHLDEPSLGPAPRFFQVVFETLTMLKAEGHSLLVVEQDATQTLALAFHACLLELDRNSLEGTGAELLANPDTRSLCLGE